MVFIVDFSKNKVFYIIIDTYFVNKIKFIMAQIVSYIPFLLFWESGVKDSAASVEQLFEMAKAKGVKCVSGDRGGATLAGVTLATFSEYCRRKCLPAPSVSRLGNLSYHEWREILKVMFWDRWQADRIICSRVANILVDWVWTSGSYGITIPQKVLGVSVDGIVGGKTLEAVNGSDPAHLFAKLKDARLVYLDRICACRPANRKFLNGWRRRLNAI